MKSNQELKQELETLLSIPKSERDDSIQERILLLLDFLDDTDGKNRHDIDTSPDQNTSATQPLANDQYSAENHLKHPQEYRKFKPSEFKDAQDLDIFEMINGQPNDTDYKSPSHRSPDVLETNDPFLKPDNGSPLTDTPPTVDDSGSDNPSATTFNANYSSYYIIGRFDGTSDVDNFTLSLGKDTIYASAGDDIINGNDGVDTYVFTHAVSLTANLATGIATSSVTGTDTLTNIENITSSGGNDVLIGDGNNNILRGGGGNDVINGGGGDDWIYGGEGTDTLTGGSGADRFIWSYGEDISEIDTITDFNAAEGDVIDMTDLFYEYSEIIEYNYYTDDISDFFRFVDNGPNTTLQIDVDGTAGGSTFTDFLVIEGGAGLDAQTLEASGNLMIMPGSRHNDVVFDPTWYFSYGSLALDGDTLVAGFSNRNTVVFYDLDTKNEGFSVSSASSRFGGDVSAHNGLAVVGARGENSNTGIAYVYDTSDGSLQYTLNNPNPDTNDYFGERVGISDSYIIVSAPRNEPSGTDDGTIYIYSTADGSLLHTIDSPEAAANNSLYFGQDVAITDNYAVASVGNNVNEGKSGTIYVFDPTTGAQLYSIENPNAGDDGSYLGDNFDINDRYILAADDVATISGDNDAGQVYLFDITDGSLIRTYTAPTTEGSDQFGQAIALNTDYSIIAQTIMSNEHYVPAIYVYNNTSGELEAILKQSSWSELDYRRGRIDANDTTIAFDATYGTLNSEQYIYQVDFLGNDTLTGTDQRDALVGLDGDDVINAGDDNDWIYGGRGADNLYGGNGDDWFVYDSLSLDGSMDIIHDISVFDNDVIDLSSLNFNYNSSAGSIEDYLNVTVSGSDLILKYNENGTGVSTDYINVATLKNLANFTLHDLILYETINFDIPHIGMSIIENPSSQNTTLFGEKVSISDGYLITTDRYYDTGDSTASGRAYIYDLSTDTIIYTYDNISSGGPYRAIDVAISNSHIIIGDWARNSGAGYVEVYNTSDGTLKYTLVDPTPLSGDGFGQNVAITETHAMVTITREDAGASQAGSVLIYDISDGSLIYTFNDPTPEASGSFGTYSALTSNYAIIADTRDDTTQSNSGMIYAYNLSDGSLAYTIKSPNIIASGELGERLVATDDYILAQQYDTKTWYVFDTDDGSHVSTLTYSGSTSIGSDAAISNDYVFAYYSSQVVVFDVTDGSVVDVIFANSTSNITGFGYSLDANDGYLTVASTAEQRPMFKYTIDDNDTNIFNGTANDDNHIGLGGDDVIYGNGGNDTLYGSAGEDTIYGGAGDDHIIGGADSDNLYGGSGADTFYVTDLIAQDTIHDFDVNDGDAIDIREVISGYDPLSDAILDFVRITDNGSDAILSIDANGNTGGENFVAAINIIGGAGLDVLSLVSDGSLNMSDVSLNDHETYTW